MQFQRLGKNNLMQKNCQKTRLEKTETIQHLHLRNTTEQIEQVWLISEGVTVLKKIIKKLNRNSLN